MADAPINIEGPFGRTPRSGVGGARRTDGWLLSDDAAARVASTVRTVERMPGQRPGRRRNSKSAGGVPSDFVRVMVYMDGGNPGSASEQCSYTYSIYTKDAAIHPDNLLAESLTPDRGRAALGPYIAAPGGSPGIAYKVDDEWHLLDAVGEVEDVGECDCS